jgi:hypothetical protein
MFSGRAKPKSPMTTPPRQPSLAPLTNFETAPFDRSGTSCREPGPAASQGWLPVPRDTRRQAGIPTTPEDDSDVVKARRRLSLINADPSAWPRMSAETPT